VDDRYRVIRRFFATLLQHRCLYPGDRDAALRASFEVGGPHRAQTYACIDTW